MNAAFLEIFEENGWEPKHPGSRWFVLTEEFKGFNFVSLGEE